MIARSQKRPSPRMESTPSSKDITSLEQLVCELTLPIFLSVYQACVFVPLSWVHHRQGAIESILRAAYPDVRLSQSQLSSAINTIYLHLADHTSVQLGTSSPEVLWKATHYTRIAHLRLLASLTVWCLRCRSPLCSNNPATNVQLYSQDGPVPASKLILRCTRCSLSYHPEWFGNSAEGYRYYNMMQPVVKSTQQAYTERHLSSTIAAAGYDLEQLHAYKYISIMCRHHAWTSSESWAEIYNEVHGGYTNRIIFFLSVSHDAVKIRFATCWKCILDYHFYSIVMQTGSLIQTCSTVLTRKHVSEALWNAEVENEVRDHEPGYKFTEKADREEFMDMVARKRATNPYPHENCSEKYREILKYQINN